MKSDIRIRAYNVGFGDCFLVSFPDGSTKRHLLIDFGSVPGPSGCDDSFEAIAEDICKETSGHLDVVVLTHEHRDHMRGFYSQQRIFNETIEVDYVWMGLPSMPGYHTQYYKDWYPDRVEKISDLNGLRNELKCYNETMKSRPAIVSRSLQTVIDNNLPPAEELDYIRTMPNDPDNVLYLHRETGAEQLIGKPFSHNVKVEILAPEEEVCGYFEESYNWSQLALWKKVLASVGTLDKTDRWQFPKERKEMVDSPANLSAQEWTRLQASIQDNSPEAICQLDNFANNMSLVFILEVCGKRLLFAGDAAAESWSWIKYNDREKHYKREIGPVDFLKVPNHGSQYCIPEELLEKLLPGSRKDVATAIVSTRSSVYGTSETMPNRKLLTSLGSRCKLLTTDTKQLWVEAHVATD